MRLADLPIAAASECTDVDLARIEPADVVIAIDASASTRDPSGIDVNRNGDVGKPELRRGTIFPAGSSDPGDSILAAQISASRFVAHRLAGADLRWAVLTSWAKSGIQGRSVRRVGSDSKVASGLTTDPALFEAGLEEILVTGTQGVNDFYAGMDAANRVLEGSGRRRIVLFLSDSADPTRAIEGERRLSEYMDSLTDVTRQAVDAGNAFHTYGLGKDATERPHFLEKIARLTGGEYRGIPDMSGLHCQLLEPLLP